MKRVFKFKKGTITNWDEPMINWLQKYLSSGANENFYYTFYKNWKVTIEISEVKT